MEIAPEVLSEIAPTLNSLESARKTAFKHIGIGLGVFAAVLGCMALYSHLNNNWVPFFASLVIGGVIFAGFTTISLGKVESAFKSQVIPKLLQAIDKSLSYESKSYIDQSEFTQSGLFQEPDRYRGKDFVEGNIGETLIRFSLVDAEEEYEEVVRDSDGKIRTETRYRTIFRGLFFVADFNKNFNGETLVRPTTVVSFFRKLFGNYVALEDPEFNNLFTVTSTDQVEARYIMTPSLMEKFKALRARLGEFRASFFSKNLYLAVDMEFDSFEPSLTESFTAKDQLEKIMGHLLSITRIVEDLGLNLRVWTKA
ncbi:MAG: DUF3137 domain-containing protein [Chthoniobacteraceae bacterium]